MGLCSFSCSLFVILSNSNNNEGVVGPTVCVILVVYYGPMPHSYICIILIMYCILIYIFIHSPALCLDCPSIRSCPQAYISKLWKSL